LFLKIALKNLWSALYR